MRILGSYEASIVSCIGIVACMILVQFACKKQWFWSIPVFCGVFNVCIYTLVLDLGFHGVSGH